MDREITQSEAAAILDHLSPDMPESEWWQVCAAWVSMFGASGVGTIETWSQGGKSFDQTDFGSRVKRWLRKAGDGLGQGKFLKIARDNGVDVSAYLSAAPPTPEALEAARARREQEERDRIAAAAKREATYAAKARLAVEIFERADPDASEHPYILAKGIAADGFRVCRESLGRSVVSVDSSECLLVPRYADGGELVGLEFISATETLTKKDGGKTPKKVPLTGARSRGCYWAVGELDPDAPALHLASGVADAASIRAAVGGLAWASFGDANLAAVAQLARATYPEAPIYLWADDDPSGQTSAAKLAEAVPGVIIVPLLWPVDKAGDWKDANDLARHAGPEALRASLAAAIKQEPTQPVEASGSSPEQAPPAEASGSSSAKTPAPAAAESKPPRITQGQRLNKICQGATLFTDAAEHDAYIVLPFEPGRTYAVRGPDFRNLLIDYFAAQTGAAPSSNALAGILDLLEARASRRGESRPVHMRVGRIGQTIYIDRCADDQAIEISPGRWRVANLAELPNVHFRRTKNMLPLPVPTPSGTGKISELQNYLNIEPDDFPLAVGWLLGALRGVRPYLLLVANGEAGSAKSSQCERLRALVDPHSLPLKSLPTSQDTDGFASLIRGSFVLAFDNISSLNQVLSDSLAKCLTGGSFGRRALFSNYDLAETGGARPILANGIPNFATAPDLISRAVLIDCPVIPGDKDFRSANFDAAFTAAQPRILSALYDAAALALARESEIDLGLRVRMDGPVRFAVAAEPSLGWGDGVFLARFLAAQSAGQDNALDSSMLAKAVLEWVDRSLRTKSESVHTIKEWRNYLEAMAGVDTKDSAWPKTPQAFASQLKRLGPALRAAGVDYRIRRQTSGNRDTLITVRRLETFAPSPIEFDDTPADAPEGLDFSIV